MSTLLDNTIVCRENTPCFVMADMYLKLVESKSFFLKMESQQPQKGVNQMVRPILFLLTSLYIIALMRCCKDLGICWELWDPRFIREFKKEFVVMAQGTHSRTGQTKWLWKRKDASLEYPYKEVIARK